jgi:hypothetical protein
LRWRTTSSGPRRSDWTSKLDSGLGWIGEQKLGLHGETSRIDFASFRWRDLIQSDHPWSVKANRSAVGVVRELDANKPVYDQARLAVDLSASYRRRLFSDRVRAKFRLNVRHVQESGSLQAAGVNPDGRPFAYRINDPRQFIVSTTFNL